MGEKAKRLRRKNLCFIRGLCQNQAGKNHPELGKVASLLPKVSFRGDAVSFADPLEIENLIPNNTKFWTYQGSLTTPPCTESVTWIIFKEAIEVSEEQLNLFRNLRCHTKEENIATTEGLIVNNFRPPLPLGNRELREFGSV